MTEHPTALPAGWHMSIPGYAVDHGQSKAERKAEHVLRYVDARGGQIRTWSHDGRGVPPNVVQACTAAAADFPSEFKP